MNHKKRLLALTLGLLPATANAALIDRGYGMVYDDDLDVTWYVDADTNGPMTWNEAMTWAYNLLAWAGPQSGSYSDWRLPTAFNSDGSGPCTGFCTDSELGHLFYEELGGTARNSILSSSDPDLALFPNLQSGSYWTSTSSSHVSPYSLPVSYFFNFGYGNQSYDSETSTLYALAVRSGDVLLGDGGSTVPVPAALWLFGSGILGLIGIARKR